MLVKCDYCGKEFYRTYNNYNNQSFKINKDSCNECKYEKIKEINKQRSKDNVVLFSNIGYELIDEECLHKKQNVTLKDKQGYFYYTNLSSLRQNKSPNKFDKHNPYTIQNVKLWCKLNNRNLELLSEQYIGSKDKLIFKDEEGYLLVAPLFTLMRGTALSKFDMANPYTIQNIKLWCKLKNKPFKLISEQYERSNKELRWQCLIKGCEEIFNMTWNSISANIGCPFCRGMQIGLSNCLATKNPELAKEWHPTLNGDLAPWNITCGSNQNVWWRCKNNIKHEWEATPYERTIGKNCPYCSGKYPSEDYNLLIINPKICEEWNYNKNDKRPEEYTPNSGQYVWWECKECGHEWESRITDRNNNHGCPECAESKGEIKIREWLKFNKIDYMPQKNFINLIGVRGGLLSYDFYLPNLNLFIEYQGEQHEKYIPGFHKSIEDFYKQVEHDRRKNEYAEKNNIKLLEIWYWDFDNIKDILEKELLNNNKDFGTNQAN